MLDTTRDVVRKSLLAMLGAITLADDELEQLLDRWAARGEQVRATASVISKRCATG